MKKIPAYLLLFLFLFNSTGYYFIFELHKYQVKKKIQVHADKSSAALTVIKVSGTEDDPCFQRIEKKEIRFNGSLYDVIKEVRSGETTIFYCIPDKKEENLLSVMKTINKNKFLLSLWDHVIKIAIHHPALPLADPSVSKLLFPRISVSLRSVLLTKWSPPPEVS